MANIKRFHPGIYIKDSLEVMKMTAREFSARTGISERTLSAIINGNGSITFDVAYKLSSFFDNSITYWTNLQTQYDIYLKEKEKEAEIEDDWRLIKSIKIYLIDYGYISQEDDKISIVHKLRKIVGVNSLSLLNETDSFICFKKQKTQTLSNDFFQNFWLALALNEARKKECGSYDKNKLLDYVKEIRRMTTQEPYEFYPRLQEILKDCGISFVLLPYLTKSNIYGATKWFSKDNVMLAISNRGEKADLFWFTLFHEISHVLMEHRRETLINIKGEDDKEADSMAANMLIPKKKWDSFASKRHYTEQIIIDFAKEIGILPCIVLGRLHKEKNNIVPYGMFDKSLSKSYKISIN